MKLFEINEVYEVELNKEWIMLIPEFAALFKRDKGSEGDVRGTKKYRTRKELSFVYFMTDFHSPIRDFLPEKKFEEALRYARLEKGDIDEKVKEALAKYEQIQYDNAPSLRTLNSLKKGMENLDNYFERVDFDAVDKQGKTKYTAEAYINNITKLPKMRQAIKEFERMVEEELKESVGIRGKAQLGFTEGKRKKVWTEGGPPQDDPESSEPEMVEM